jgi:phosphoribosyl 1,2-cyclic phosphate phosphodiesterase
MKITFLGTGTSQGVPVIACSCEVCTSSDSRDNRLRTSIFVDVKSTRLVVDTGPDFRQQMLREQIVDIDAVLFTHEHKDHIAGLDDVRAFNFKHNKHIPLYATESVHETIKREYGYAFEPDPYPGVPLLELRTITAGETFGIKGTDIVPIEVKHAGLPVMAFRFGDFSYITDANYISKSSFALLKGTRVLVINALRKNAHQSHFTLDEALNIADHLQVDEVYFTHISHLLGKHEEVQAELPAGCFLAYDGLKLGL